MTFLSRKFVLLLVAALLSSGGAFAGEAVLTLKKTKLTNVADAAGSWQHETGTIANTRGTAVGSYILIRRSDIGGENVAAAQITLLFPSKAGGHSSASETVTLQGDHDFSSGGFKGSVSAASSFYSWVRGADAYYTTVASGQQDRLIVDWTGSDKLALP